MIKQLKSQMTHAYFVDIGKCENKTDRSVLETFAVSVEFQAYVSAGSFYTRQIVIEHYPSNMPFISKRARLGASGRMRTSCRAAGAQACRAYWARTMRKTAIAKSLLILMGTVLCQQKSWTVISWCPSANPCPEGGGHDDTPSAPSRFIPLFEPLELFPFPGSSSLLILLRFLPRELPDDFLSQ